MVYSRERQGECMKYFEGKKKPDGKQNKGKAQENEERRKMRGEERNNREVMFVTRICQNGKISTVRRQIRALLQREIRRMDANTGEKSQRGKFHW